MEREIIQVCTTKKDAINTLLAAPHEFFSKRSPNTPFRISYDFYWETLIREYTLTSFIGTARFQPFGNSFCLIVKRGEFETDVGEGLKTQLPPSIPENLREELIEKITHQTKMEIKPWESNGKSCFDFNVHVSHYVVRGPDDFVEIPISEDGFFESSFHAVPALNQAIESLDQKNVMLPCGILKETCAVCHEEFPMGSEMAKMRCSHWFHEQCIKTWLETKQTCPVCRYKRPTITN